MMLYVKKFKKNISPGPTWIGCGVLRGGVGVPSLHREIMAKGRKFLRNHCEGKFLPQISESFPSTCVFYVQIQKILAPPQGREVGILDLEIGNWDSQWWVVTMP